ncbi:MAG: hypothetical protein RIF41_10745 [Polyangiaceae bacterium]
MVGERRSAWLAGGIILAVAGACADERSAVATRFADAVVEVNVPARGQGPAPHPVVGGVRWGSTIQLARVGDARVVLVADADGRALRVLDGATDEPRSHLPLGGTPSQLVVASDGRIYVALRDQERVVGVEVVDPEALTLEATVRLETPIEPVGLAVSPDGGQLLVTSGWAGELSCFDVATRERTLSVRLPREPRGVAVSADGATAIVVHALGSSISRVPLATDRPEPTALALAGEDFDTTSFGMVGILGSLAELDVQTIGSLEDNSRLLFGPSVSDKAPRAGSESANASSGSVSTTGAVRGPVDFRGGGGVGEGTIGLGTFGTVGRGGAITDAQAVAVERQATQGFALAMSDEEIFVPQVLVHRGRAMVGGYGTSESFPAHQPALVQVRFDEDDPRVRVMNRTFAASTARSGFGGGASRDGCMLPRAAAIDAVGGTGFVAWLGSDAVIAYAAEESPLATSIRGRWHVPSGPEGLAVDREAGELIVWSAFAGAVSRVPLPEAPPEEEPSKARGAKTIKRVEAVEPSRTVALEPVAEVALSALARQGRAIFHGATDRRISADGRACASCHPDGRDDGLSWPTPSGARQTPMLAGRLLDATKPYGWQGDAETIEVHLKQTFARLGGKGLDDEAMAALLAYLQEMGTPSRSAPAPDPEKVARGKELFHTETVGCAVCHTSGGVGSDGARHDVGTGVAVETPSLRFVARTGPYLHDGRYETLSQLLRETRGKMGWAADMPPEDLSALEAYLLTL